MVGATLHLLISGIRIRSHFMGVYSNLQLFSVAENGRCRGPATTAALLVYVWNMAVCFSDARCLRVRSRVPGTHHDLDRTEPGRSLDAFSTSDSPLSSSLANAQHVCCCPGLLSFVPQQCEQHLPLVQQGSTRVWVDRGSFWLSAGLQQHAYTIRTYYVLLYNELRGQQSLRSNIG